MESWSFQYILCQSKAEFSCSNRTQILQEKLGNAWNDMTELEQLSISKLNPFCVDYML